MEKAREFQKTSTLLHWKAMLKPLTVWITTKWNFLKRCKLPDHLTPLLRNLYSGQEANILLNGEEFEQTPWDSGGQRNLACCSPGGCRVRHDLATEQQQEQPCLSFLSKVGGWRGWWKCLPPSVVKVKGDDISSDACGILWTSTFFLFSKMVLKKKHQFRPV